MGLYGNFRPAMGLYTRGVIHQGVIHQALQYCFKLMFRSVQSSNLAKRIGFCSMGDNWRRWSKQYVRVAGWKIGMLTRQRTNQTGSVQPRCCQSTRTDGSSVHAVKIHVWYRIRSHPGTHKCMVRGHKLSWNRESPIGGYIMDPRRSNDPTWIHDEYAYRDPDIGKKFWLTMYR